jgi:hypothetical protein
MDVCSTMCHLVSVSSLRSTVAPIRPDRACTWGTYAGTMEIPVACTLSHTAAHGQIEEWRTVLAASTVSRQRLSPTEAAVALRGDFSHLESLVRLAQREKACCAFFDFSLRIETDAITLVVSVPPEAASALDHFAPSGV